MVVVLAGFAITIITIELLNYWIVRFGIRTAFFPLAIGPLFGWLSLAKLKPDAVPKDSTIKF